MLLNFVNLSGSCVYYEMRNVHSQIYMVVQTRFTKEDTSLRVIFGIYLNTCVELEVETITRLYIYI